MSIPGIDIGALFIGREDREGDDGSGVATEDDDDTDAEAGGYARDFLEVILRRLWEGRFGKRRTTTKTTETSRDNEHEEDVMPRSMFETLCRASVRRRRPMLARSADRRRLPRRGWAGWIHRGRNNHGRGEDDDDDGTGDVSVTTTTTNDYHTYNDETTRIPIYSNI